MRPGEIIGLKWSDIKRKDVNLKRSINVYGEVTKGKNDNARRSFQLTDFSQQVLNDQKEMLKQNGITSNFVFPNEYGDNVAEKHIIRDGVSIEIIISYRLKPHYMSYATLLYQ